MFKKLLLSALIAAAAGNTKGQDNARLPVCGYDLVMDYYEKLYPGYQTYQDQLFRQSQEQDAHYRTLADDSIKTITVVFHVVYNTAAQNLHDSIILNQLDLLNKAYRRKNADTANTREIFKPVAADARIEFKLATVDPDGQATTGITRTQTDKPTFGTSNFIYLMDSLERVKKTAAGGIDPWPTDKYLNIWVANIYNASFPILGLATPPTNPYPSNWPANSGLGSLIDGVLLQYQGVGGNNPDATTYAAGITLAGKTAVHEVGHYLGLRHIWGDAQDCSGDDGIADTPPMRQSNQNASCNTLFNKNTCTGDEFPDMIENYMDYSRESCQNMFTLGQVNHMRTILSNQREPLKVTTYSKSRNIQIFPNPAKSVVYIAAAEPVNSIAIKNILGQTLKVAAATELSSRQIDISNLSNGLYLIHVETAKHMNTERIVVAH